MPTWNQLVDLIEAKKTPDQVLTFIKNQQKKYLDEISELREGRNVLFYGSAFLQKPSAPADRLQIMPEDLNAFMAVMHGMDWAKGLTLILHTPGGVTTAAETLVSYLRSKFDYIEVIIPTFAMSAGTMISLAADRIVMGRQSQLGPIDPQLVMGQRAQSAQAIVDQFEQAKKDILQNPAAAAVWFPIIQSIGPALIQESRNAIAYGERMVAGWLENFMFKGNPDARQLARAAAAHFNDATAHKSHGRRIGRDEARTLKLTIEDLEDSQPLQEAVLSLYHLMSITMDKGPAAKIVTSGTGRAFIKNWAIPGPKA